MDAIEAARHQRALIRARRDREDAAAAYDDAVRAARTEGVPKADIARWLGVTRPTIDRIIRRGAK